MSTEDSSNTKYSSILTKDEIAQYEAFGEIDYEQDHLELFTDQVIEDLMRIKDLPDPNQDKADVIKEYLGQFGFVEIDLGTNIYVMAHHRYPGVVFKIALDDNGVADNFNDDFLGAYIPELVREIALDPTGIVSVQERKVVFRTRNRFNIFTSKIVDLLIRLQKQFVLVDVNLRTIRNFGLDKDGSLVLVDASDLFFIPDSYNIFKCRTVAGRRRDGSPVYCGHRLRYSDDFSMLVCDECHRGFNPLTLRRGGKRKLEYCDIHPGLSMDDWRSINDSVYKAREAAFHKAETVQSVPDSVEAEEEEEYLPVEEEPEDQEDSVRMVYSNSDEDLNDDDEVSVEQVSDHVQSQIKQRLSEVEEGEIRISVDNNEEDPAIYIALKDPGDDLEELLRLKGPDIYLSVSGGREYMKCIPSNLLASLIMTVKKTMVEEGTWEE